MAGSVSLVAMLHVPYVIEQQIEMRFGLVAKIFGQLGYDKCGHSERLGDCP